MLYVSTNSFVLLLFTQYLPVNGLRLASLTTVIEYVSICMCC